MKISVVIPCHNAERYLEQTVQSVLDQTRPADEIILVDDASTDGSLGMARQIARRADGRVQVVAANFRRATRVRNLGGQLARGDALMFLDADDVLWPDALQGLCDTLSHDAAAIATCPWLRLVQEGDRWLTHPPSCAPRGAAQDALDAWLTGWYHPPASVLWSREAYERAGRWDEHALVNQDGDLMMRALARGIPLLEGSRGLAGYRRTVEPSLSGTRITPAGLRSRIRTVLKIACLLADAGRLKIYRAPLGSALARIAADAGDSHPDIASEARRLARQVHRHARAAICAAPAAVRQRFPSARAAVTARDGTFAQPSATVIVPTFNRAGPLLAAVESVLRQTYGDFELLVVDDASTDGTPDVIARIADARVRYLRQPRNLGTGAARNRGLREARGELIAFLDSDDEWMPEKLARQVARFQASAEDLGLVYTGVESVYPDGHRCTASSHLRGNIYREMLQRNVIHGGGSNVMIRRAVVAAAGFFPEDMSAIEDYEYWLRVSRFFDVDVIEQPLVRYVEADAAGRRSRAFERNLLARWGFYQRHRPEMRRLGVAHLFLLNTSRWALNLRMPDHRAARRLALQAVIEAPLSRTAYKNLWTVWRWRARADRPVRVLTYTRVQPDHRGGVQGVIGRLAAHLARRGHHVIRGWAVGGRQLSGADVIYPAPHIVWRRGLPTPRSILGALRALCRLVGALARYRPDVVNFHFVTREALLFLALRPLFGYKLVLSVHGSDVLRPKPDDAVALPRLLHAADGIITVSRATAARVLTFERVEEARVHLIRNGIDYAFWSEGACDRSRHAQPTVLAVGRLHPVKGHDVLLDAFRDVRTRVPEARLIVVGEGGFRAHLEALVDEFGLADSVTLTGELRPEQVREHMRAAHCFVLPSRSEGLPLTLLEAMAAGLPVVASSVGGVVEVLTPGTGEIVPPESPRALAEAVSKVLLDPAAARTAARAASDRVRAFSASSSDAAYEHLLLRLLGRSHPDEHGRSNGLAPALSASASQVFTGD